MQDETLRATALITQNSLPYVERVFALHAARKLLITVPDADTARRLPGVNLEACLTPDKGHGWFTARHDLIRDDLPAQVSFTSGTEGTAKGIVLTHANLSDTADRIIRRMGLTAEVREYVGVPVTYSFGMGRIRAISAVGGRSFLPARGFDPRELAKMLAAGEVNSLSAVPTLLRTVLQHPEVIGEAGKKLRWLEIGSQYMAADEKRAIRALFPAARIVQHYGLTEASRSTFLEISGVADDLLESVGRAEGSSEIGLSGDGRIRIRGPHVARWRLDSGRLQPLLDDEGWLQTGDLGHCRDGYLFFDGRADDLINTGGLKVHPDEIEARLRQRLGQGRLCVARVPDALRGEGILVVAEAGVFNLSQLRQAAVDTLKTLGLDVGDALHLRLQQHIPETATGKPLRRRLAEEFIASEKSALAKTGAAKSEPEIATVLEFFEHAFPGQTITTAASFESLGGDSLRYIQFSMGYEKRFGPLPSGWDALPIQQLQKTAGTAPRHSWRKLESATLTRAFFMTCIVALHVDAFVYSSNWGAAYFLYMLAGYSVVRFQWPQINRSGKVTNLLGTVLRVAIPTVMVVAAMQLLAHKFELKPLLLISNIFDPSEYQVAYYYFAEIYMQLLLIAAVLFSIPGVRRLFFEQPLLSGTALLGASMLASHLIESVWDTTYIFHRSPHWYAWTVAAGMLIASARSLSSRLFVMAVVTAAVVMHFGISPATAYISGGVALLLFLPEISVPGPVKTVVGEIAAASMFMYLSHYQVSSLVKRLFHAPMPWVSLGGALVFGIVFARLYGFGETEVRQFAIRRGWVGDPGASARGG